MSTARIRRARTYYGVEEVVDCVEDVFVGAVVVPDVVVAGVVDVGVVVVPVAVVVGAVDVLDDVVVLDGDVLP